MRWRLSRYRVGDWVEVRGAEEILAGLDENGCLDGMPFMPEMLAYCGRRLRVRAVAHKTCDTAKHTWTGRRLDSTVHLEDSFCDGSAHGGCEAACSLFWKDSWLKPVDGGTAVAPDREPETPRGCTRADLVRCTSCNDPEPRYVCQATQLVEFTRELPVWDLRQYVYDVRTGNRTASQVLRVLVLAWLRWLLRNAPVGYRVLKRVHDRAHIALSGRPSPYLNPSIKAGERTPTGRLDLQPGERVRIKSQDEIERTLDETGRNRGLTFDSLEMAPYCGSVVSVRKLVTRIIDEPTGRMRVMKQPCVMLDGVVCRSLYSNQRLNCPRAIPSYWRELWLERAPANASGESPPSDLTGAQRR